MDDPLDLKLLMNQQQQQDQDADTSYGKNCQQELCHEMYSDKNVYESNRHQKDQQVVQIMMNQNLQVIPQPAHQHVQSSVVGSQSDQMAFKRGYAVEHQQMYTVAPASQYQIVSANSRGGTVSIQQPQQQVDIQTYSAPAYIVTTAPDGTQQIQSIQEHATLRQDHVLMTPNQIELVPQVSAPVEIGVTSEPVEESSTTTPTNRIPKGTNLKKNRPYKCDKCTASFLEPLELDEHKAKHTDEGPFTCEDCHFTFMFKGHYRSHKARCEKKRAAVGKPENSFVLEGGPIRHKFPKNYIKKTQSQKQNQGPNTTQASSLVAITKVNTKQTKFNPNNPSFVRNKKSSRLDRPFECNECYASFIVESDLKSHKLKHTGEGPFSCDTCKYVFLFRKLYEAHRRRCDKKHKNKTSQPSSSLGTVVETSSVQSQSMQVTFPQITESSNYVPHSTTIEMPSGSSIDVRGGMQDQEQLLTAQPLFDSNSIPAGSIVQSTATRDLKYELMPATPVEIEGMNVKQMINLIKVKPQSQ